MPDLEGANGYMGVDQDEKQNEPKAAMGVEPTTNGDDAATPANLPSSELPISQMDIATVRAELEKDDIAPDRAAALHGRLQQLGA